MKSWKNFERGVAKQVVATFKEHGIQDKDCYRTPLSGGHIHASKNDPGDLVISRRLRRLFPFHVECKAYNSINMAQLLVPFKRWKKSWKWSKWFAQVTKSCTDDELIPLLVFKEDNGETIAAFPVGRCGKEFSDFSVKLSFLYENQQWCVVRFKNLLWRVKHIGIVKAS